jgi:hypothetical protein
MSKFNCRCNKCGIEQSYEDLKEAYMDGWNVGRNAICYDCQSAAKESTTPDSKVIEILEIE